MTSDTIRTKKGRVMDALVDGIYEEIVDDAPELAQALLAGAAPLKPPAAWFDDPGFKMVTPMTITADGRIMGHIAPWAVDHIGLPGQVKPPRSRSNYAFFRTGLVATAEGNDIPVGQITLAGGHASMNADAGAAVAHYDDTATAFADVVCGEDMFGIWASGALRPSATEEQIRAIKASAPSGDWRPINGSHELVGICQVNVPGFPVARVMVAGGQIQAMVACGASAMYALRMENALVASIQAMENRLTKVEDASGIRLEAPEHDSGPDEVEEEEPVTASGGYGAPMSVLEKARSRQTEIKKTALNQRMDKLRGKR